jgi:type IV pilus assembly protein PilB
MALGVQGPASIFTASEKGCPRCKGAGYRGRIGVHEVMVLNEEMKTLISRGAPAEPIRQAALANGMVPLYEDAMEKVLQGVTSLDEALATVRKD